MLTKENSRLFYRLILSIYFLYIVSIGVKLVYSAQMVEIGPYFGASKSQLSIGITIYYIVYAIAQLVLYFLLPKLNIKKFIIVTVTLSGISFGLIGFLTKLWMIWLVFGLNGIFQVAIWGGSMSILGKYLPDSLTNKSILIMSTGMAVGTGLSYGLSAFCTALFSWKLTFIIFSVATIISVVFFATTVSKIEKTFNNLYKSVYSPQKAQPMVTAKTGNTGYIIKILFFLSLAAFLTSFLYYALTNWYPSLLKEVHKVPSSFSQLITLLVPLGTFFGPFLSNYLSDKKRSYYMSSAILTIIFMAVAIPLIFTYNLHIVIAIFFPLVLMFCVRGILNNVSSYASFQHRDYLEVGKTSLISNAVACVSAALAPLVSSLIMESYGWGKFFAFLLIVSAVIFAVSIIGHFCIKPKQINK